LRGRIGELPVVAACERHPMDMRSELRIDVSLDFAPRGDGFWQWRRPARQGFRVCGVHGAGYAKREREGLRTNPALAPVVTGAKASCATLAHFSRGRARISRSSRSSTSSVSATKK
jgi:hypothetical protein